MNCRPVFLLSIIVIITLGISGCAQTPIQPSASGRITYKVADGSISYAQRPDPQYTKELINETVNASIYRIVCKSRSGAIYGLISIPDICTETDRCPGFVLLPAQSITKEIEQRFLGNALNDMGFVTLAIDQRGHGETKAVVMSTQEDFSAYLDGRETSHSMMVYDALAAYDILAGIDETDVGKIYMAGESMGGRFAIIAASIEPGIQGLLLVSTAGYGLQESEMPEATEFMRYIDPDNYINSISPRKIAMIHGTLDWVMSPDIAKRTFEFANEPKRFTLVDAKFHGYYNIQDITGPEANMFETVVENDIEWLTEN